MEERRKNKNIMMNCEKGTFDKLIDRHEKHN